MTARKTPDVAFAARRRARSSRWAGALTALCLAACLPATSAGKSEPGPPAHAAPQAHQKAAAGPTAGEPAGAGRRAGKTRAGKARTRAGRTSVQAGSRAGQTGSGAATTGTRTVTQAAARDDKAAGSGQRAGRPAAGAPSGRAATARAGRRRGKRRAGAASVAAVPPRALAAASARAARRAATRRRAAVRGRGVVPSLVPASTFGVAAAFAPVAAVAPASPPAAAPRAAREPGGAPTPAREAERPSVVTRTIRSIEQVIPGWAWALIGTLAALLALATLFAGAAARRERRARRQRTRLVEQVGLLQAALLPDVPAQVGPLATTVAYRPAEGLAAGGDFYDVFALERGRVGVIVGDVAGHGHEALGAATFVRHMIRSYLEAGLAPRAALQLASRVLDEQRREDFATVVAGIHDGHAGTLSYAAAGHPPPIVLGPSSYQPLIVGSSPPLGIGWPTGQRQTTLPLPAGSTVCFYSDGLIESRTPSGMLGAGRLAELLEELGPRADAGELLERVRREADHVGDDMAAVIIHAREGAVSSLVRVEEVEVTLPELHGLRLHRFLQACGIPPAEIERTIKIAAPRAIKDGAVVLRARLADERSGVDVLPAAENSAPAAELASIRRS